MCQPTKTTYAVAFLTLFAPSYARRGGHQPIGFKPHTRFSHRSTELRNAWRGSRQIHREPSTSIHRDSWVDDEYKQILDVEDNETRLCSVESGASAVAKSLLRGSFLRIASDLSGGTPLESIKCRVTITNDGPVEAVRKIVKEGGVWNLWAGTPSRTVEGALLGAMFLAGSSLTKQQVLRMGGSQTLAALCGGLVGGVVQAIVMTPAGMIFTSLNAQSGKPGFENDNAITITRRILKEKGFQGMFIGGGPMALRQATNWASRSCFTEIARTTFGMSDLGLLGEIGSGVIGGVGSCWNTPIETVRVFMQRDVSAGLPPKTFLQYCDQIVEEGGYPGLFRGVTPRAIQAIWQTVFMVVVPNVFGF